MYLEVRVFLSLRLLYVYGCNLSSVSKHWYLFLSITSVYVIEVLIVCGQIYLTQGVKNKNVTSLSANTQQLAVISWLYSSLPSVTIVPYK